MQDRFQFKCWHEPTKTMYEVFDFNKNFIRATPDLVVTSIRTLNAMDCVLMQCTGLKDEKGKLIYEGDIVKDDHEALFYIKWCYNCFQLNPLFTNGYTLGILDDEFEVIGNIYENPELLNDNQKRAENLITNPESEILDSIKRAKIKTDIGKAIEELIDNE